jgi:hypothetical protein
VIGDRPPHRTPFLLRAKVIKAETDDKLLRCTDDARIGNFVIIDLNSKQDVGLLNQTNNIPHIKSVVQDACDGGWWPWECLEVVL